MNSELQQSGSIRSIKLREDEETAFINRLQAILRGGRLNNQYPDARRLSGHLQAMKPEVHRGIYSELEINVDSGLPTYKEWTRVQTDVSIATDQLRQLGDRKSLAKRVATSSHEIHQQQLDKYDYYDSIADTRLAPLGSMDVALRRVNSNEGKAHFYINFDKLDVSGIFVRFQIALSQQAQVWSSAAVTLDDDTASYTEEFKSMIYKFSSLDAEFTYTKLATLPGIEVERISRGTVGPIFYGDIAAKGRIDFPEPFDALVKDEKSFVALFGMETVAYDISDNVNNDPFGGLFESELSRKMRPTYARSREQFGYKVYKDRKFVVSRGMEAKLRDICSKMNTKNIVYSL